MINRPQDQIGRPFERRPLGGDSGWNAGAPEKAAVRLGIFIQPVAAQRQERRAWHDLAFTAIEPAQECSAPVELVAERRIPVENAVMGVPQSTTWLTLAARSGVLT